MNNDWFNLIGIPVAAVAVAGQVQAAEYLTVEQAAERYGVIFAADGTIDVSATFVKRETLTGARETVTIEIANEDDIDGPRRLVAVPSTLASNLGISEGDLVELRGKAVAPLRGWARVIEGTDAVLSVGPAGMRLLNAEPSDGIEIRAVHAAPEGVLS